MEASEIKHEELSEYMETEKCVENFKEFFSETLPFVDSKIISKKEPGELISILKEYWNKPASFDHFKELMKNYGEKIGDINWGQLKPEDVKTNEELSNCYKEYLLNKLPEELKERWIKDLESGKKTYEDLYHAVSRKDFGLIVGFNTSPVDIKENIIKATYSEDEMRDPSIRKYVEDKGSKAWYSLNEKKLFPGKSPKYLYIVEGSRSDLTTPRYYNLQSEAVYSHSNLRIRFKMPLTDAIMKKFGFEFLARGIAA